ncbi:MAG: methyltransferase domain-containing protein [Spirochaetes bacterium]|nr:methyltransferase domain-containing protein [Spirochaetota bacterium]
MKQDTATSHHICPWWLGFFLASPLRRLYQDPESILGPCLGEGVTAVDVGCGMGFFSLPMARMVGPRGRVVCIDVQEKMLRHLARRAARAGLSDVIEPRLASHGSFRLGDLAESADFLLLFAVIHEVGDRRALFLEGREALKRGGCVLVAEPRGHESTVGFERTLTIARECGFAVIGEPSIRGSRTALLEKV